MWGGMRDAAGSVNQVNDRALFWCSLAKAVRQRHTRENVLSLFGARSYVGAGAGSVLVTACVHWQHGVGVKFKETTQKQAPWIAYFLWCSSNLHGLRTQHELSKLSKVCWW